MLIDPSFRLYVHGRYRVGKLLKVFTQILPLIKLQLSHSYFQLSFSDILVNNAGILRDRTIARTSDLDWGEFAYSLYVFAS